jgi:hypothetical protein
MMTSNTPMMQAFATSKDMVSNSAKWAKGGTERIDPSEYLMRARWDAAQLGGYATGIPIYLKVILLDEWLNLFCITSTDTPEW